MDAVLKLTNFTVSYDDKVVVNEVSLTVHKGEILAIVGESGSGKSTVIRGIMGLLSPSAKKSGSIDFLGTELTTLNEVEYGRLRGKELAIIFQNPGNFFSPLRTIDQHYDDFLKVHGIASDNAIKEQMLLQVGFMEPEAILKSYISELSGGMQQRVGIAMAMTLNPQLLLADEPTSALDAIHQEEVLFLLKTLCKKEGTSLIFVTHNLKAAQAMADRIVVMDNGVLKSDEVRNADSK